MSEPVLRLQGVHTHIGAYHILHGVDLAVPAGEVTVTEVAVLAVMLVAGAVPNSTDVAEPRLVPVTTTLLPPPAGPLVGAIEVTVGAPT